MKASFALWCLLGMVSLAWAQVDPAPPAGDPPAPAVDPGPPAASAPLEAASAEVVDFAGLAQVSVGEGEPWIAAVKGMKLGAGASVRTGPRSFISLHVPPDHIITLDRLGTVTLLELLQNPEKTVADIGLKYGRAYYEIQTSGRQHETRVHSPGVVLAVRGTQGFLQNERGRRVMNRVISNRPVTFGVSGGKITEMNRGTMVAGAFSPAHTMRQLGTMAGPLGVAQTDAERGLIETGNLPQGLLPSDLALGSARGLAARSAFPGGDSGVGNLIFALGWSGDLPSPASNVDLRVTTPAGEVISAALPLAAVSGGVHSGDDLGGAGFGLEQVVFRGSYPRGNYQTEVIRASGASANFRLDVFLENSSNPGTSPISSASGRVTSGSPSATGSVQVPPQQAR